MPMPNGGLITETNAQYYAGAQGFTTTAPQQDFTFTFNTPLNLGNPDPASADYTLNNFKLYASSDGITYTEVTAANWPAEYPYSLNVQQNGDSVISCPLHPPHAPDQQNRTNFRCPLLHNNHTHA